MGSRDARVAGPGGVGRRETFHALVSWLGADWLGSGDSPGGGGLCEPRADGPRTPVKPGAPGRARSAAWEEVGLGAGGRRPGTVGVEMGEPRSHPPPPVLLG